MAGLNEARGVYIIVGIGGGGGVVDIALQEKRKQRIDAKARKRQERKEEKESKRLARRDREGSNDGEEEDTEEEDDDDESDDSDDDAVDERGYGRNRFGNAFQEVVDETNARVRIDSFESCVVEIKKEDLSGFLESLSMKAVIG